MLERTSKASNGTHGRWKVCQEELAVWFDDDFLSFLFFKLLFLVPAAERGFSCFVVLGARVRSPRWLICTIVPAVCFLLRLTNGFRPTLLRKHSKTISQTKKWGPKALWWLMSRTQRDTPKFITLKSSFPNLSVVEKPSLYDCVYSLCFFPPILLLSNLEAVLLRWCGGT